MRIDHLDPDREPLIKLLRDLGTIKKAREQGADDWQWRVVRCFLQYLQALGLNDDAELRGLIDAVAIMHLEQWDLVNVKRAKKAGEKRAGARPMVAAKSIPLVFAAACVTELFRRKKGTVPKLARDVAKAAGFDKDGIVSFRNQLHRKRKSGEIQAAYEDSCAKLELWTDEEIFAALDRLGRLRNVCP